MTYDSAVFSVTAADVHLGTVPASGSGWQLTTEVNAATGQIGIELYSTTPISSTLPGSLVTIDFRALTAAAEGVTAVDLVPAVNPGGRLTFQTSLADNQGLLTLHTALTNTGANLGVDGQVTAAGQQATAVMVGLEVYADTPPPSAQASSLTNPGGSVVPASAEQARLAATFIDDLDGRDETGIVRGDGAAVRSLADSGVTAASAVKTAPVASPVFPADAVTTASNQSLGFNELPLVVATPAGNPPVTSITLSLHSANSLDRARPVCNGSSRN